MREEPSESQRVDEEFAAEQTQSQRLVKLPKGWKVANSWIWAGFVSAPPFVVFLCFSLVIMPKFKEIYEALGGGPPPPARVWLSISEVTRRFWPLFTPFIGGLWFLTARYLAFGKSTHVKRGIKIVSWLAVLLMIGYFIPALFLPVYH